MCGIAGWFDNNKNLLDEGETIIKMGHALSKRGPDGGKELIDNDFALVERRLGNNPLLYGLDVNGKSYVIILDGAVYNAGEIRYALKEKGYEFTSDYDNELILKSYIAWGNDCLLKINGVFAFAIYEKNSGKLFAARDRIGAKPFFFYEYNGGLIFGSEIKALMQNKLVEPILDSYGLKQIMLLGPGRSPGCGCIKGVKELKSGQYLEYSKNSGLNVKTFWRLVAKHHTETLEQTIDTTRDLITDSIERQLIGDKEIVTFLSGGLDSSIISMLAAKKLKEKGKILTTYSVDYEDNDIYFVKNQFQPDADGKYIKSMNDFINSNQKTITLNNLDVAKSVFDATLARDLPGMADIDGSLLLFLNEVKKTHDVGMSGECADEIFGGYPWYHNPSILFKESFPWSSSSELRKLLFKGEYLGDDADDFIFNEYKNTVDYTDSLDDDSRLERRMREMFMLNFYWFMQTLVDRNDRMSMYSGVDVRVPFCDYRLVEYAFNMPWHMKSLNGREKGIVREAFKDLLPKEVVERKKSPFPKTYSPVLLSYVTKKAEEIISDKNSLTAELVNKSFLYELSTNSYELKTPWYGQLMRVPQIFGYIIQLDTFINTFNLRLE